MLIATPAFLADLDSYCESYKTAVLSSPDAYSISGTAYYVSNDGNDDNDGLSETSAWRTIDKVNGFSFNSGDGVLFRRGDTFRGRIMASEGVTYASYGNGAKPNIYGWDFNLADQSLWHNVGGNIYKLVKPILDCGTLVFNGGEKHSYKHIPSYVNGKFVCRDDENKLFDMFTELTGDLDIYWHFDAILTTEPSKGENFPIPKMCDDSYGTLYLRCDAGNPGAVFSDIEALTRRHGIKVTDKSNVHIDNLCLKYIGLHAIGAETACVKGLKVTNCEIGWIGGTIQHYLGTDPNYPEGGRGTVTRYGNAVEIYGGCDDYEVSNCYIYQVYDAGITHQVTTWGRHRAHENVRYLGNLVEYCVYGIEYFLEKNDGDSTSYMNNIVMRDNIIRFSGYGWGQQRHNKHTPAHIKGWSYENTASNYVIENNIFDRAQYRMLHLVAKNADSLPILNGNTFIQYAGNPLGQYGANCISEPPILTYDDNADEVISSTFGDSAAKTYIIEN